MEAAKRHALRNGIDLIASIGMIVVSLMLFFGWRPLTPGPKPPTETIQVPIDPVALDGLPTKGNPRSSIGLIVYSDFQCPFCRKFAIEALPDVQRQLIDPGVLTLAFKHLPLETIHPQALAAAALAECGHRTGAFWKIHDRLFSVETISAGVIQSVAFDAGLAQDPTCSSEDTRAAVRQHQKDAATIGVSSTPTFLLGTFQADRRLKVERVLIGFQSAASLSSAVKALQAVKEQNR